MSEGDWCDPPERIRKDGMGKWQRYAAELKERPGEWRCVFENRRRSRSISPYTGLRDAGCEVTTRQRKDGNEVYVSLWARWPA